MAWLTRKFSGKEYKYYGAYNKKSTADNVANRFRAKKNGGARILSKYGVYVVYVR